MDLRRYLEVLHAPGVSRLVLFAPMGRLPFGILSLSIILLMRREGYDYGEIGAVLGAGALALGLTAVFLGRLVDRVGQTPVLLTTAAISAVAICGEAAAIVSGAPVALVVAASALEAASTPPISASMRALWDSLDSSRRHARLCRALQRSSARVCAGAGVARLASGRGRPAHPRRGPRLCHSRWP